MTTTFDNQKLYDIAVENSLFLESVKLYEFNARMVQFRKLKRALEDLLLRIQYDELTLMTKKSVDLLIKNVKQINQGFYDQVSADILDMFEKFTTKAVASEKRKWVGVELSIEQDDDVDVTDDEADDYIESNGSNDGTFPLALVLSASAFAAKLLDTQMTGFGRTLPDVLKRYNALSERRLVDLILSAHASGYSKEQLMHEILGEDGVKAGKKGALGTMRAQLNAIIDTAIAFSVAQSQAAVNSAIDGKSKKKKYIWVSIMDSVTSLICRERNRKVYEFNKGPLPPAHINCRSSISPILDNNGEVNDSDDIQTWVKTRSSDFQQFVQKYGSIDIRKDGSSSYHATKPMTPDEFFKLI